MAVAQAFGELSGVSGIAVVKRDCILIREMFAYTINLFPEETYQHLSARPRRCFTET